MRYSRIVPTLLVVLAIVGGAFTLQANKPWGAGSVFCTTASSPICSNATRVDFVFVGDNFGSLGVDPCPLNDEPYYLPCSCCCTAINVPTPYDAFRVSSTER